MHTPATEYHRPSSKLMRAPPPPAAFATLHALQSNIPINPSLSSPTVIHSPMIKDLRHVDLLHELYPTNNGQTHVQETVEIIPQPVSYERIFHSYIDDHTDLRSLEYIKLDQDIYKHSKNTDPSYSTANIAQLYHQIEYDHRFKLDFYSSTLYIFPKQRNEKFISEIRYIPEHITIRYKTTLDLLATSLAADEHYYQNIQDFYQIAKDIFYRI